MAIYQTKAFGRFARQHRISRHALVVAARNVRDGRFDAYLGSGLYKQRVPRLGGGKSSGFRTLIAHRTSKHLFFLYGFPKSDKANIDASEERVLKESARELGDFSQARVDRLVETGELEVLSDGNEEDNEDNA